jgi:hypothetical protein
MISNDGETKQTDLSSDLVGRTFFLEPRMDGQHHRTCPPQFAYDEVLQCTEYDEENTIVWSFKRITALMLEWENGEITSEPLVFIAADDPITCADINKQRVYKVSRHLLMTRGAMIYFGINGSFPGSDDRTSVEGEGIDAHRINNVLLAAVGSVTDSNIGKIKVYRSTFPLQSREGCFFGVSVRISEHVSHAMATIMVLRDDTSKVFYYSEIWPAPSSKWTPLDDVFDGEKVTEFGTTMRVNIHKVARDTSDGETTNSGVKDASIPQFHPLEKVETAGMYGEIPHGETPHGETLYWEIPHEEISHGETPHGEIAHGETASTHVEATGKHEETTHGGGDYASISIPPIGLDWCDKVLDK